jgi:hypothetical protein
MSNYLYLVDGIINLMADVESDVMMIYVTDGVLHNKEVKRSIYDVQNRKFILGPVQECSILQDYMRNR